jgi:PAS domain S-box-containing protein
MLSPDKVSAVLRSIAAEGPDASKQGLGPVLLEHADDVIHVLSLNGVFLYLSPSSRRLLEYEASELIGKAISSVCHPSDIASAIRELKQSVGGSSVDMVYRIRRKNSGYMWFESHGLLHIEPGKRRKCLILVGRERPVYALNQYSVLSVGGIGENDLWTKMAISGILLFVSSNVRVLLDRHPNEMVGRNLQEFMRNNSRGELGKALAVSRTGQGVAFKHEMRHKRGHVLQAQTTLFPGDATPGSKPSFLVAQTRLLKCSRSTYAPQRSSITSSSSGDMASAAGFASPSGTPVGSQPQAKTYSVPLSSQALDVVATEAEMHGLPLGNQNEALLSENNIFEELKSTRSSSWQFELRQLERRNRLLAEELQGLLNRRKKRKRKKGTGPLDKACANCRSRSTPEWRRGPSGNRDLCNSCGLRWAKQVAFSFPFLPLKSPRPFSLWFDSFICIQTAIFRG